MKNLKRYYDAAQAARQKVTDLATEIDNLFETDKTVEALAKSEELKKLRDEERKANELYAEMQSMAHEDNSLAPKFIKAGSDLEPKEIKDLRGSQEYRDQFFMAIKNGVTSKDILNGAVSNEKYGLLTNALTETGGSPAGSEGGILLPVDFDNMIKELQRLAVDLSSHFNVEEVTNFSGWRAIETAAAALPFAKVTEGNSIAEMENPAFTKLEYTLEDYAGYLPAQLNLMNDTPVAIQQYIAKWAGRKKSLTNTSLILALINAITPTPVSDYKTIFTTIKTVLNKQLDPAISVSSKIFCNQSGFDLLDQLVDGTGRPFLAPDPTNETVKRFKGREVVELANSQWPDTDTNTKTRIAIGDGRDFATLFRRSSDELASTTVGGDSWRKNQIEFRYIMRADVVRADADAMKLLSVTLPS